MENGEVSAARNESRSEDDWDDAAPWRAREEFSMSKEDRTEQTASWWQLEEDSRNATTERPGRPSGIQENRYGIYR